MAPEFRIQQHLKMSPNAQIKNLVPETLSDVPPVEDWKLGRIWFNESIGKFQCIALKMDSSTGLPLEPNELEVVLLGSDELGFTRDGEYYPDGLFNFTTTTKVSNAVDEINEALKDLAPAEATALNGDLTVTTPNGFHTGKVSKKNVSIPAEDDYRMDGINEGDLIDYIITTNSLTATLPTVGYVVKDKQQSQFGKADQGLITGFYDGVAVDNGINLFANFNEDSRDYYGVQQGYLPAVNQNITATDGTVSSIEVNPNKMSYRSQSQFLTINTVERYNDFKKWQKGDGVINIGTLTNQDNIEPGRHEFYVSHSDVLGGSYKTNTTEIFYDPCTIEVDTSITDYSLDSSDTKMLSGVTFHNSNIVLKVSLEVDNAFSYTYWDQPIQLTSSYTTAGRVDWNDAKSNLVGETIPFWNDKIILTDYIVNYTGTNTYDEDVTMYAKAGKVSTSWGNTASSNLKLLVDTNPTNGSSTNLRETFNDEDFRLADSVDFGDVASINSNIGTWDSSALLESGNAQQYMGILKKAQDSYSTYGVDVDYSPFKNEDQYYYRAMKADNKANSNGTLKITTNGTFGTDYEVSIKFPGITGWLDISSLYDTQDFANNKTTDGTGCAVSIRNTSNAYEVDWTIGTNSTVDSGYLYAVRILLKNKSTSISEIAEISSNWS